MCGRRQKARAGMAHRNDEVMSQARSLNGEVGGLASRLIREMKGEVRLMLALTPALSPAGRVNHSARLRGNLRPRLVARAGKKLVAWRRFWRMMGHGPGLSNCHSE